MVRSDSMVRGVGVLLLVFMLFCFFLGLWLFSG